VIRELVRDVYGELNRSLGKLYASEGRPSIAPEQLLSALLLQVLYGIRSERQPMEQLDYNLLDRWFVGLFRPMTGCGAQPPSPRTATGCRKARFRSLRDGALDMRPA
jgi:transposase